MVRATIKDLLATTRHNILVHSHGQSVTVDHQLGYLLQLEKMDGTGISKIEDHRLTVILIG